MSFDELKDIPVLRGNSPSSKAYISQIRASVSSIVKDAGDRPHSNITIPRGSMLNPIKPKA